MLKMFKIPLYTIILLLFSFTALEAIDSIPDCPSDKTIQTLLVVGYVGPESDLLSSLGVEQLEFGSTASCYNFDRLQAFKIVKNNNDKRLNSFQTNYSQDVLIHAEDCSTPGVTCRWVDPHPRGLPIITNYGGAYLTDGSPAPKICLVPINFTKCKRTQQQNQSQNMQKNQFKSHRGNLRQNRRQNIMKNNNRQGGAFSGK